MISLQKNIQPTVLFYKSSLILTIMRYKLTIIQYKTNKYYSLNIQANIMAEYLNNTIY